MLNMTAGRGEKANMTDTGPHCLKGWTLPLAFGVHGILGETFETEHAGKQKGHWFPPPQWGACQQSPATLPAVACVGL